jgi:hypothetical protein
MIIQHHTGSTLAVVSDKLNRQAHQDFMLQALQGLERQIERNSAHPAECTQPQPGCI